jgi:hypothetical protein
MFLSFFKKNKPRNLNRILRSSNFGLYSEETCGLVIDLILGLKHLTRPTLLPKTRRHVNLNMKNPNLGLIKT